MSALKTTRVSGKSLFGIPGSFKQKKTSFANFVSLLLSEEVSGESNKMITCHSRHILSPFLPVYKHPYIGEEGTQLSLFTPFLFELFIAPDLLKNF